MVDLRTHYMGLVLDNPLIVASSGLTGSPEGVEKAAAAGAGAVVLKSLFEEQILAEVGKESEGIDLDAHPEAEAFAELRVERGELELLPEECDNDQGDAADEGRPARADAVADGRDVHGKVGPSTSMATLRVTCSRRA